MERLSVHGVPMTDDDLSLLEALPRLSSLELFGTKVSLAASQKFGQTHPGIRVDRRSNAKLGIMGENGSCKIAMVQPGSAAEQAGLLADDVILKFQGHPVNDFAGLTAEIGACEAGDKVTIEVSRAGDTLKKEVTLGAWK
jgi:S1-C subfamily serine protease